MKFQVVSDYKPTGDQPQAIEKLAKGKEIKTLYRFNDQSILTIVR